MQSSLLANLLLFLSLFGLALAAPEEVPAAKLEIRQTTDPAGTQSARCLDYEMTANFSTIGANSSYRTAFLQKSNVGTIYNARMLDAAILKLPAMTADAGLNQECGNKTDIAITGAAVNYTQGIVAQFTTEGLPVGIKAGPEVIVVVAACCLIFSGVWIFSG